MKPAPFEYHRPTSVDEALSLLEQHGYDAKLLAGGQSLIPAMNFRLAQPAVLIDLNRVAGLAGIGVAASADGDGPDTAASTATDPLRIMAMTRQREVERSPDVARVAPLLADALPFVAHPQIRNRGTLGGSAAHADPASEIPGVLVALDARLHLRGPSGTRELPARDFFTGLFGTALEPDEMLTAIDLRPLPPRTGWAFEELSRRHGDFALAGVATAVTLGADGRCQDARIALFGVGDGPMPADGAVAALIGSTVDAAAIQAAADAASTSDIDPPADIHASSEYRRRLVRVLVTRALTRAAGRLRA